MCLVPRQYPYRFLADAKGCDLARNDTLINYITKETWMYMDHLLQGKHSYPRKSSNRYSRCKISRKLLLSLSKHEPSHPYNPTNYLIVTSPFPNMGKNKR